MQQEPMPVCVTCGIAIRWRPTIVDTHIYCCLGCAQGGPCQCDYDNLPELDEMEAMVLHTPQNPKPSDLA
jgi:hypothetical protein